MVQMHFRYSSRLLFIVITIFCKLRATYGNSPLYSSSAKLHPFHVALTRTVSSPMIKKGFSIVPPVSLIEPS